MGDLEHPTQDYKFLGQILSYDEKKQHGMIGSEEIQQIWNADVYIHKKVMDFAGLQLHDFCRFGVHLSAKGLPQASLPVFKIGDDGEALNAEGENVINVEEAVAEDPELLAKLELAIGDRSSKQNQKRDSEGGKGKSKGKGKFEDNSMDDILRKGKGKGPVPVGKGKGKGPVPVAKGPVPVAKGGKPRGPVPVAKGKGKGAHPYGKGDPYGEDPYGADPYGAHPLGFDPYGPDYEEYSVESRRSKGGKGGKGTGGVELFISGVPADATPRELNHIFRQYAGFMSIRTIPKGSRLLVFATFANLEQAEFVAEALDGYVFDLEAPGEDYFNVQLANQ